MRLINWQFPAWLSGLWRDSIQRRLALAFGGISLLMMLGLTGLLMKQQQDFLDQASIRRAGALANGLVHSSSSWVLANDLVGLKEVLQGYTETPNLQRAFVLSPRGEVLASTRDNEVGLFVSDSVSQQMLASEPESKVLIANAELIDVAAPILLDNRLIGWVRVELDQQATKANLKAVVTTGLQFLVLTTLIVLTAAILLAAGFVKRLQQLMRVAAKIESGSREERATIQGRDEISQLSGSLNNMLDTIVNSERQLDRLNRVYAAWTESVATIVRVSDETTLLRRICEILVEKIDLRLALVGMLEPSGWIRFAASSDANSAYLQNLRVSVDPSLPESQGPIGQAIRMQAPHIFNDFLSTPDTACWHRAAKQAGINAVAAFPLRRNGQVIGALGVYSAEINYFSQDIINLLDGLVNDISFALDNFDHEHQRQQAETELTLAASVFDNSQEGIMITDAQQVILRVNGIFARLTGYQPEEIVGKKPSILASNHHDAEFYRNMWECINRQKYWQGEIFNRRKDGRLLPEWLTITQVTNKAGQLTHYVGTFVDITDRKLNEERIFKLAFYDPLTELPNRRLLVDRLREALLANQRKQHFGALMFLDLDRFKILNDTQGHDLGDQLLIEAGKRITASVREEDTVARLGGDEFVILLEDLAEDESTAALYAQRIGNKVLNALSQIYLLHRFDQQGVAAAVKHHSSASIGITLFSGIEINCEDLLRQADMAMYQAKQAGRNTLCLFDPDMQSSLNRRAELEADLRFALHNDQLRLTYQIQVDQSGQPVGAEALLRWEHPLRGLIEPMEFVPLAEESGLIVAIGSWVLIEACKTLNAWAQHPATAALTLSVNVSAKQLGQADFIEQLQDIIENTGANPQRLKLEITESTILDNLENTIWIMLKVRQLGLSFAMDDFGTGYSSLSYLQRLPLAQLKIDRSFVHDLQEGSNDAAIIRTILALGKSLDLEVVAEGVESVSQHQYLLKNGCRLFQGYLFGKPCCLDDFQQQLVSYQK